MVYLFERVRIRVMTTNDCVVFGAVSSGKSTFLNALLQKCEFAMGEGVTTRERSSYPLGRLNLVDLPGVNENNKKYMEQYRKDFTNAMLVFCVLDKQSVSTMLPYYTTLLEYRSKANKKNIFLVVNKSDEIDDVYQIEKELKSYRIHGLADCKTFFVSSRLALSVYDVRNNTENLWIDSIKYVKEYLFGKCGNSQKISSEMLDNVYESSGFEKIKNVIEHMSNIELNEMLMKIVNENDIVPNRILLNSIKNFNEKNKLIRNVIKIGCTAVGLVGGVGILGIASIVGLALAIPTLGVGSGAVAITSGLAAFGFGGMMGGVATAMVVGTGAALGGAALGGTAGLLTGKISGDLSVEDYKFDELIGRIEITEEDLKNVEYVYEKTYVKDMKKLSKYLPIEYKSDLLYADATFVKFHDKYYVINGEFRTNKIEKVTAINELILKK